MLMRSLQTISSRLISLNFYCS